MSSRFVITAGVQRSDVLLTTVLLALSLVQVLWVQPLGSLRVSLLVAAVAVLPLAWRRARPVFAAGVGTTAWLVPTEAFLFLGFVVAILLFFSVGRQAPSLHAGVLTCAWGVAVGTVGTLRGPEEPVPGLLSTWLAVLASYVVGRVMRMQEREAEERLASEREATRLRAVEEERSRIVSELHDVLGHEVTLIAIQSEAASQALQLAPEQAAGPVAAVRETAQRASRELRAILGLLGHGELPVATDERGLSELTDRAARLGIPTTLTVTGTPWTDAPQHWLAVNRIVQECLTNAGKHAPGEQVNVARRLDGRRRARPGHQSSTRTERTRRHGSPRDDRACPTPRGRTRRGARRRRLHRHHEAPCRSGASNVTTVLLADDQAMVRSGLRMILELRGLEVVGEASDGAEAAALAAELAPDVVLMDVRMPGTDGIEGLRRIVAAGLPCRVVVLTTFDLDRHVYDAMRAGAAGFLLKDATAEQLVGAVERAAAGEVPMAPQVMARMVDRFIEREPATDAAHTPVGSLSPREREVLGLMAIGLTNPEIAERLVVSLPTVKTHVRSILAKLDARDRVQAVLLAHRHGLAPDE